MPKRNSLCSKKHKDNIISIFCEKLFVELMNGAKIDIDNFCTIEIKKLKSRKHHNVNDGGIKISSGKKKIKFTLKKKLKKFISNAIKD